MGSLATRTVLASMLVGSVLVPLAFLPACSSFGDDTPASPDGAVVTPDGGPGTDATPGEDGGVTLPGDGSVLTSSFCTQKVATLCDDFEQRSELRGPWTTVDIGAGSPQLLSITAEHGVTEPHALKLALPGPVSGAHHTLVWDRSGAAIPSSLHAELSVFFDAVPTGNVQLFVITDATQTASVALGVDGGAFALEASGTAGTKLGLVPVGRTVRVVVEIAFVTRSVSVLIDGAAQPMFTASGDGEGGTGLRVALGASAAQGVTTGWNAWFDDFVLDLK